MRPNEICQLTLDDFAQVDGVDVILIRHADNGETKRIKTEAGIRFVPVHPELRTIGLLSHVEDGAGTTGPIRPPSRTFLPAALVTIGERWLTGRSLVFTSLRRIAQSLSGKDPTLQRLRLQQRFRRTRSSRKSSPVGVALALRQQLRR
jgi:hypothetical protein